MYCVKCGVELSAGETACPLCGTVVYHPDLELPKGEQPYPDSAAPAYETVNKKGVLLFVTVCFAIAAILSVLCDLHINGGVVWSGYAVGGLLLAYIIFILPAWFSRPNPVIFVPVGFAAAGLYLLYISLKTQGGWFLSFAFPVVGCAGLLVTAVVTLVKYVKKGYWYIAGGAVIALGGLSVLVEFFIHITFGVGAGFFWSVYPLVVCFLLGMFMIVIGICRPLRRCLHKKFFL